MSLDQLFNSPKLVAPICEDSDREVKRAAMQACACGDKLQDLQKCGRHIKKGPLIISIWLLYTPGNPKSNRIRASFFFISWNIDGTR